MPPTPPRHTDSHTTTRGSQLTLPTPPRFTLAHAVCSYGYFLLEPCRWDPDTRALHLAIALPPRDTPVHLHVSQPASDNTAGTSNAPSPHRRPHRAATARLSIRADDRLDPDEQRRVKHAVRRMLRLDDRATRQVAEFHRLHPKARRAGFGRLFRSATLWEDMVKTITGCNVSWPNTINMNRLLCQQLGRGAFPTPHRIARLRPDTLQRRCKVGYRATRIVKLARAFDTGRLDTDWFEDPNRQPDELRDALLSLEGFGPYAAANVLQLLGHYDHLPIDSETYRHHCLATGTPRPSRQNPPQPDKSLDPHIEARFQPYRPYRFLAYWFELWDDYQRRHGPAWTWQRETTGTQFTASQLQNA